MQRVKAYATLTLLSAPLRISRPRFQPFHRTSQHRRRPSTSSGPPAAPRTSPLATPSNARFESLKMSRSLSLSRRTLALVSPSSSTSTLLASAAKASASVANGGARQARFMGTGKKTEAQAVP